MIAALSGTGGLSTGAGVALAERVDPRPGPSLSPLSEPFSIEWLKDYARELAESEHSLPADVPVEWQELSYDEYRAIRFNSRRALWQGTDKPVRLDFFHPGLYFPRPVDISIVQNGEARAVEFNLDLFTQGEIVPQLPVDDTLGYSGLRIRGDVAGPDEFKEFVVFQGASYFRAIAREQNYGLSARGLALRTGDEAGEEFPEFTRFWIEEPQEGARKTVIHALLDSPSVTGVYTFETEPGDTTIVEVDATIYPRVDLDHVGIAPLTSMFLFDETNRNRFDDFRPAVHDSEGLLIRNGSGEVLWRPLANPTTLQVSQFLDDAPKGFGLMQRSRKLSNFADLEAHYHTRPSLWIVPGEGWGPGSVSLVEIPADREIYDNIVAYWRPRGVIAHGQEHSFSYRMRWGGEPDVGRDVARVLNTRMGKRFRGDHIITVDFADHPLIPDDLDDVKLFVSSNVGETSAGILQRNPETGGVRLAFSMEPGEAESVELRAQLMHDGKTVSEVWLYRWTK